MTKRCLACYKVTFIRITIDGEVGRVCEECQLGAIKAAIEAIDAIANFERNFKAADNTSKIVVDN